MQEKFNSSIKVYNNTVSAIRNIKNYSDKFEHKRELSPMIQCYEN